MSKYEVIRITENSFVFINETTGEYLGYVQWASYNGLMWFVNKRRETIYTSTGNWPSKDFDPKQKIIETLEEIL